MLSVDYFSFTKLTHINTGEDLPEDFDFEFITPLEI